MSYSPKSQKKYDDANTVRIALKLNKKTDAELLTKIDDLVNKGYSKQSAIKHLINSSE